ncbi:MAG TPA: TRAP transporter small permease [Bacillus bacterium]|nr:TRAP transporter small permease [Bacillus sp. (in: firmicutes)]
MSLLKKIDRYFEESIIVVLFSTMVLLTFTQVLSRFVLNLSLGWSEEVSRFIFVWVVYLSAAMAAKHRRHIRVEIIDTLFPRAVSKWFGVLSDLLWIAFALYVAFYGFEMVTMVFGHGQLSPAVQLPMGFVYSIIPFGFGLIAFRVLQGIVGRFRGDDELSEEEKLKRAIEG